MHAGHYISGAGHVLLIAWAFLGGAFRTEPLPFEVTEVSVITGEEYAAIMAAQAPPEAAPGVDGLAEPAPEAAPVPEAPAPEPPPVRPQAPPETAEPQPDRAPEAPPEAPAPEAEVADSVPELAQPEDTAILLPDATPRPEPRPADRVAPTPAPPPPSGAETAPDTVPPAQAAPEPVPEPAPEPEPEPTAPEEATTEIVTEAEERDAAPDATPRPRARPERLAAAPPPEPAAPAAPEAPAEETEDAPSPAPDDVNRSAVDEMLAEALGGGGSGTGGPPLTGAERDALRVAVQECWVVDVGSQAANVTVTLAMSLSRDGTVMQDSLRLVSSEGGEGRAVDTAYQAARRAVLRCERGGYDLPPEKYDQWRDIEMTFNPENMRVR